MNSNSFKRHRFPPDIILLAVRWYCRYPLSYRDVRDLLAERGVYVDPATINRWVVKFGPVIAKCVRSLQYLRSMGWHVDETCIRVSGKWRYLWRIVDEHGRFVDFRLTAKRDSKAANAFLKQACRDFGLKRITDPGKGFHSLRTAKATLLGVEAFRSIKRGYIFETLNNTAAEVRLMNQLFGVAA